MSKSDRDDENTGTRTVETKPLWYTVITAVGIPTFLLLWFMGAFDSVLASPVTQALRDHDRTNTQLLRAICLGMWRDDPRQCD